MLLVGRYIDDGPLFPAPTPGKWLIELEGGSNTSMLVPVQWADTYAVSVKYMAEDGGKHDVALTPNEVTVNEESCGQKLENTNPAPIASCDACADTYKHHPDTLSFKFTGGGISTVSLFQHDKTSTNAVAIVSGSDIPTDSTSEFNIVCTHQKKKHKRFLTATANIGDIVTTQPLGKGDRLTCTITWGAELKKQTIEIFTSCTACDS